MNDSPQFSVTDINFKKYDDMIFDPLRFDNNTEKTYNDIVSSTNSHIHECTHLTPENNSVEIQMQNVEILTY